ncbi:MULTISPECIES: SH3 domain-containing protein [Deefgea]|uniref:SH3 domain-containing protein n=1 Tax=Deefgea chitinilytica TaxID=570276 RepID=A0ABS2CBE4_9NEIS|nr:MULTISPECIES: SH3 domain-containing protein [Deefgea]MBM5571468.1 SH3 domain-containing protein [Deefgea chitinilytica]MBM9888701.1 SH3 domain-containing protein [Deefgea sp. CFH1-16]
MRPLLPLAFVLVSSSVLAQSGTVVRKTDLRDKPFLDAAVIAPIAANTPIEIQANKGAWMQVKAANGQVGWIKLLNVRTSGGGTNSSSLALGNVIKTGSSGQTVTTGVKGLSAEQIRQAEPNPAEVEKMDSYASTQSEATRAAVQAKLIPQDVAALTTSTSSATSAPSNGRRP